MDPLPLGTVVSIPQGRGIIRFLGLTEFAGGTWVGVELNEPNGKNNGTINGVAYFSCRMNYGVFIRQSQIKATHGLESDQRPPPQTRPIGHRRTNSGLLRASTLRSGASSASIASTPTSSSRSQSPARPITIQTPTKVLARSSTISSSPPKRTPSLTLQQSGRRQLTKASADNVPNSPLYTRSHVSSTSKSLGSVQKRTSSPLSLHPVTPSPPPVPATTATIPNVVVLPDEPQTPRQQMQSPVATPSRPQEDPHIQQQLQELQELRTRFRILETKRSDDVRHIRELEAKLDNAKMILTIQPKLQAKLSSLQQDLISTKRELADSQQLAQLSESRVLDSQEQLEMIMLDKEVAEERAENAESEVEELKEKLAIVEVEIEVLKGRLEGDDEGGRGDDDKKEITEGEGGGGKKRDHLAFIQLEKQNERLKEALIKLRDISQETDQEQKKKIQEMEKDIEILDELQVQYDETLIKLSNAETEIEELKLQLDDALHAEDLLVSLTERNLELGETIEEMRITIEDLEALKELNDELEENHLESEKQLYEDIEKRDIQIREQQIRISSLEDAYQDLEGTINQFRELVVQLQTDLETMRAQTQTAQSESASATSQAAAMISLNMKLQSSASKNQARNIDLEIKKMEARESKELLSIVQPYLPELYVQTDSDATSCYLYFLRLANKTDLINSIVTQKHNMPDSLNGNVSEVLVGICEMRSRISNLSTLCKRFATILKHCDTETFLNVGRIYQEIAPLEKRLDMHLDLLRRDEFREMECVNDIAKIQAQFEHISETYFEGFDHDLGEKELGYVVGFDLDLDMFMASVALTRTCVIGVLDDPDVVMDLSGYDVEKEVLEPLIKVLELSKSAKVISKKLTKRLEDLTSESAALKSNILPLLQGLSNPVAELVNFGISLAQLIMTHTNDARSSKSSFHLPTVLGYVKSTALSTVSKDFKTSGSNSSLLGLEDGLDGVWESIGNAIQNLIEEAGKVIPKVLDSEYVIKITGTPPWIIRITQLKTLLNASLTASHELTTLQDQTTSLLRTLKTKDQTIQELSLKIDFMERKLDLAKGYGEVIEKLERELDGVRNEKRIYEELVSGLQSEVEVLEVEVERFRKGGVGVGGGGVGMGGGGIGGQGERQALGVQPIETENLTPEGNLETSYLLEQVDALKGTVRFLRTENSYLKGQDLLKEIEGLPVLNVSSSLLRRRTPTPGLDPSGLSDTDEDEDDVEAEDDEDKDEDEEEEEEEKPITLRSLTTETKLLYRDVIKFSSAPKVVDLSLTSNRNRNQNVDGDGDDGIIKRRGWIPRKKLPVQVVLERKMIGEKLNRRVRGLVEKVGSL